MRHPERLREVAQSGLCLGCGLGQSEARKARVEMA